MINFGREACGRLGVSSNREWLVTNGIGGYAMGTIAGILTRRYHGLLIAALKPPLGRTLMFTKLDEMAEYLGQYYPLHVNRWFGEEDEETVEEPHGHFNIEHFCLEGGIPCWTYACADALLEKRIWMPMGENSTYIQYTLKRATAPLGLYPKAFINYRDHHLTAIAGDWQPEVEPVANGISIIAKAGAAPLYLLADRGEIYPQMEWYEDYYLKVEDYRGQPDIVEDHLHIADFSVTLQPGESVTIVASTKPNPLLNGHTAYRLRREHEQKIIDLAETVQGSLKPDMQQLVLAADQFIVKRTLPDGREGHSILAGYPWFSDWGRDTMISLPGLTLCTGRPEIAASILRTYAHFVSEGMLPNRFPDEGEKPEYNTVDATLWYFQAIRTYWEATSDEAFMAEMYPVLQDIVQWHIKGTRYNIKVDPADGLLFAGEAGVQLTWMDVKIEDWVVTPRTGKAIEINALWYNALCTIAFFAEKLGKETDQLIYDQMSKQVKDNFHRFWYSPEGYCYDVIDGPDGHDAKIRPNQLMALALSYSPLDPDQQKAVLEVCTQKLITSYGLRSLANSDPDFIGIYKGDQKKRDAAYHQGTVWSWLIGPFIAAHLRVHKNTDLASTYLQPMFRHLYDHGLGSVSEIFDGDAPFKPHGCPAQAWGVAEYLRSWCMIHRAEQKNS